MMKKHYEQLILKPYYSMYGIVVPLMVTEVVGIRDRYDALRVATENTQEYCTEIKLTKRLKGQAKPSGVYMGRTGGHEYYATWKHIPITQFAIIRGYYEGRI